MQNFLKCLLATILLSNVYFNCISQNFNYSFAKDSSSYSAITGGTVLSSGDNWRSKSFKLHLPFQFNFCGTSTDSITIEGNGFVVFDNRKGMALMSFNNFSSNKDTAMGYESYLSYLTEGGSGNYITKIEFKNLSQQSFCSHDNLTYQVWLYEAGNKIEVHVGKNSYSNLTDYQLPSTIGLVNKNMDTENKAFLLLGNPSSPSSQLISGDTEFVYLNNLPNTGVIFKLSPNF